MRTEEEKEILRDGESIRVTLNMMDSVQRGLADHRAPLIRHAPGYAFPHAPVTDDAKRLTEHTLMVRSLSDAWRGTEQPAPQAREAAVAERDAYLRDAWRA